MNYIRGHRQASVITAIEGAEKVLVTNVESLPASQWSYEN
jgi:hypothetical protein